uniref:Chloride channel CLIC-like protein 1 n=1 Tax=Electrophorus electricus TaxID=8005 RepID=A0AAY5E9Z1_ELEEL
ICKPEMICVCLSAAFSSQQQTCSPVFKRFLQKLLKKIEKLDLPTDINAVMHHDAEVKLSKQGVTEIENLLNHDGTWRTGALDEALSQILINFKLHDYEAWKWRFEDTFGVELETVIKVSFFILIVLLIICTEMWSTVSWFVQFKRMFTVCFVISLAWNWLYLYKIELAKQQADVIKVENVYEKCTGLKKIDWKDNLRGETRRQLCDDPFKQYYEVLMVNPILLVPPTKAITITITTFITDPLKHIGQALVNFSEPCLKTCLSLSKHLCLSLLCSVSCAQVAIQHAVVRPLRGWRGDPPPAVQPPSRPPPREVDEVEDRNLWARGDADRILQPRVHPGQEGNRINQMRNQGHSSPEVHQRRHIRPKENRQRVYVETLRDAENLYSGDEADNQQVVRVAESSQHKENEPFSGDVAKEENEASTHAKTNPEHSRTALSGPSVKSDDTNNKASRDVSIHNGNDVSVRFVASLPLK